LPRSSALENSAVSSQRVFTIGHSTRTIEDLIGILRAYNIEEVVDVRTIPRSRHNPQFNIDFLPGHLEVEGIAYHHMPMLGGLRHPVPDSVNNAWRNLSFRGYADYMQTNEFQSALEELIDLSKVRVIVLMCAESVPWRCHRSLIADALLVRKIETIDIFSATNHKIHKLTPWAKVRGKKITYPETSTMYSSNPPKP
jgi:uncharacterized protein (DUF488 family)